MKLDFEAFYVVAFDVFGTLLDMSGVDREGAEVPGC